MEDGSDISPEDLKQLIDCSEKMRSCFAVTMQGLGDVVSGLENIAMAARSLDAEKARYCASKVIAKAKG